MKKIKNIGQLDGTILLFGGIYSNLEALTEIKNIAENLNIPPHQVINTGDIVGYCADPQECLDLVRDWNIHNIAGNVEIQLREGQEGCGCDFEADSRCDLFARQWYPYAQQRVNEAAVDWLNTLPEFIQFDYYGKKCVVVHGSYFYTSDFVFRSTPWEKKVANFDTLQADVIIGGHCGLPFHDVNNGQAWLNPGVIGMPANDGTTRVWYMLLHPSEGALRFTHESFIFDYEETFARMLEEELPIAYAKTLTSGLWDNCDILPSIETKEQGVALYFE